MVKVTRHLLLLPVRWWRFSRKCCYVCLRLSTFVYVCLRLSTFVYVCDGEGVRGGGVRGGARCREVLLHVQW